MGWDLALVKLAFKLKALELVTSKIMFHCFLETEDNDPFFIEIDFKLVHQTYRQDTLMFQPRASLRSRGVSSCMASWSVP
jgi:hypothetical protein